MSFWKKIKFYYLISNLKLIHKMLQKLFRPAEQKIELIEDQFRRSLNTFIDICLVWGTEPILMTQFNRVNLEDELFNKISLSMINKEEYVESYVRLNDVIREVSMSRNVDLIDLANLIPSSSYYMYDPVHLNENGSKLAAEILTNYWIKKLELK